MELSPKRTNQLLRMIPKLDVKQKACISRIDKMIGGDGKDYYSMHGFHVDDEIAETAQAERIKDKVFRRLGME